MSETTNARLQRAYSLIENEELEKAREILTPLLEDDADNPHLWWVYTHAAPDQAIGQAALERVLALDPQYPGARELKTDVLDAQASDPDLIAFEVSPSNGADAPTPLEIDDWEDLRPVADIAAEGSSSRAPLILFAALLAIVAAGALVISGAIDLDALLSGLLPPSQPRVVVVSDATSMPTVVELELEAGAARGVSTAAPEPTAEAVTQAPDESDALATAYEDEHAPTASAVMEATSTVTPEPEPTATVSPGSKPIVDFVSLVAAEVENFAINESESGMLQTSLGDTLLLRLCAVPGPEFNQRLNRVLSVVASLAEQLPDEIEAVAAGLINCDDADAALRMIGVARAEIAAFARGEIDDKDFQRAWQPLS